MGVKSPSPFIRTLIHVLNSAQVFLTLGLNTTLSLSLFLVRYWGYYIKRLWNNEGIKGMQEDRNLTLAESQSGFLQIHASCRVMPSLFTILILQIDAPVCRFMRASKSLIVLLTSGFEVKDQENIMPLNSSVMSRT